MFPRLLALLCLLSLSQVYLAQTPEITSRRVPDTCAVTKPLEHPFVPPWPYLARGVNWFGTDRFWTFLPSDGIWGQEDKTFWFRQEWVHYKPPRQWILQTDAAKLTVTARRLDGPARAPEILKANSSYQEQDWKAFLVGGINFPTPGCWEVSGRYENDELTFVVWVLK